MGFMEIRHKDKRMEAGEMVQKIVIIAGTIRTGSSAIVSLLRKEGFIVPGNIIYYWHNPLNIPLIGEITWPSRRANYKCYESLDFSDIIKSRDFRALKEFKNSFKDKEKIVLKYCKASRCIDEILKIFPEAYYIYVLRNPLIYLKNAIRKHLKLGWFGWLFAVKYIMDWLTGYSAMMEVKNLYIISYERLLKFPELEKKKLLEFVMDDGRRSGTA